NPTGDLLLDGAGNLYGTTAYSAASGAVYELAQGSGTISTVAQFGYGTEGGFLNSGVIMDGAGNLYGTAPSGGPGGWGTIFEISPGSSTITVLAAFNNSNGGSPLGGMVMDGAGNLFGTTYAGGAGGYGTIFELAHGSSTITTLASFDFSNGA